MLVKNSTLDEKKSYFAQESERLDVQERRADYIASIDEIDPDDMIFIDESGANLAMTYDYARAKGGQRVNSLKPCDVGSKFSIVGAIALTGIVAILYVEAAVNGEIFREFIR